MEANISLSILIDSTYKIHKQYYCAIILITIDSFGQNCLLAFAMVHNEQTADYIWFFNNLREVGFENPETVIADRNKAQFNALQQFYGRRMHIVFCWWHIKGNIINSLPRKNEDWLLIKEKFYKVYGTKNDADFDCEWQLFMIDHPEIDGSAIFKELYDKREHWAKFAINNYFTAGTITTSRIEGMHAKLKQIIRSIKRSSNIKIFTAFMRIVQLEDQKIALKEYINTKNTTFTINTMRALSLLYSEYCLNHYQNSIYGIKATYIKENRNDEQRWIVSTWFSNKIIEYHIIKNTLKCSCKKYEKYKILCCHLLFIAKTTGRDVIEFIIQHTARRWLMPALSDENNEVLLKKIKGIEYYHKRNMTPVNNERRIR